MNLHKRLTLKVLAIFAIGFAIVSCDNDDPEPVNEEELITTVNVTFTNSQDAGDVVTATFQDLDGPGGNAATQSNLALSANSTYTVSIEFLNEQETPAEDITEEVAEEDDEHQVFYVATAGLNFTFAYADQDGDGNPLGLAGTATTGAASTGSVTVSLIHEPTKTGAGVSDGDPTNANGETDVEVTFTTTIQ